MYPVLHVNMAVAPYVVSVPILFPFGGQDRLPHEMTGREGTTRRSPSQGRGDGAA